jgi:hypothetical protein
VGNDNKSDHSAGTDKEAGHGAQAASSTAEGTSEASQKCEIETTHVSKSELETSEHQRNILVSEPVSKDLRIKIKSSPLCGRTKQMLSVVAYLADTYSLGPRRIEAVLLHSLTLEPECLLAFASESEATNWMDVIVESYATASSMPIPKGEYRDSADLGEGGDSTVKGGLLAQSKAGYRPGSKSNRKSTSLASSQQMGKFRMGQRKAGGPEPAGKTTTEKWLNQMVDASMSLDHQRLLLRGEGIISRLAQQGKAVVLDNNTLTTLQNSKATPLGWLGIDRISLRHLGLTPVMIDRVYNSLYVYSAGFENSIKDINTALDKALSADVRAQLWCTMCFLLEHCTGNQYTMTLADAQRKSLEAFHALNQECTQQLEMKEKAVTHTYERLEKSEMQVTHLRWNLAEVTIARDNYHQKFTNAQDHRDALLEEAERLQGEHEDLLKENDVANMNLNKTKHQNMAFQKEAQELKVRIAKVAQEKTKVDKADQQKTSALRVLRAEIKIQKKELEKRTYESEQGRRHIDALEHQNKGLKASVDLLKADRAVQVEKIVTVNDGLVEKLDTMGKCRLEVEVLLQEEREESAEKQAKLATMGLELSSYKLQTAHLKERYQRVKKERTSQLLEKTLEANLLNQQIHDLKLELKVSRSLIMQQELQLMEEQGMFEAERDTVKWGIAELESEKRALEDVVVKRDIEIVRLHRTIVTTQHENVDLSAQLTTTRELCIAKNQEIDENRTHALRNQTSMQMKIDYLNETCRVQQEASVAMTREAGKQAGAMHHVETTLASTSMQLLEAQATNQKLAEEIVDLVEQHKQSEQAKIKALKKVAAEAEIAGSLLKLKAGEHEQVDGEISNQTRMLDKLQSELLLMQRITQDENTTAVENLEDGADGGDFFADFGVEDGEVGDQSANPPDDGEAEMLKNAAVSSMVHTKRLSSPPPIHSWAGASSFGSEGRTSPNVPNVKSKWAIVRKEAFNLTKASEEDYEAMQKSRRGLQGVSTNIGDTVSTIQRLTTLWVTEKNRIKTDMRRERSRADKGHTLLQQNHQALQGCRQDINRLDHKVDYISKENSELNATIRDLKRQCQKQTQEAAHVADHFGMTVEDLRQCDERENIKAERIRQLGTDLSKRNILNGKLTKHLEDVIGVRDRQAREIVNLTSLLRATSMKHEDLFASTMRRNDADCEKFLRRREAGADFFIISRHPSFLLQFSPNIFLVHSLPSFSFPTL